ncbi:MAG: hypothetical protein ACHRXM_39580 [Isosphaerales bacterium]
MASPPARARTPVEWLIRPISVRAISFPVARLVVYLYFGADPPGPETAKEACWLDTGAPLSVVPFNVHHQRLLWQPIPGVRTSWSGQSCDLGRVDFWLGTDQPPNLRGPMSLLAKFARSDPPGPLVPVLLGLEFFLAHRAEFQLFLPPRDGSILLP